MTNAAAGHDGTAAATSGERVPYPAADGFAMPPEWAAHRGCYMAWPCHLETYGAGLDAAREAVATVAAAIAGFEPVTLFANPEDAEDARRRCGGDVTVVPRAIDDSWARDSGATFLTDGRGGLAGVDWVFNAWGGNYPDHENDAALAAEMIRREGARAYSLPVVMEGGGVHTDGEGTLLTTDTVILNPNRNPGLSRAEAEGVLTGALGAETVIWLDGGALEYDDTDGHVDNLACFVRPGVVMALVAPDESDPQHARLAANVERLRAARDARGRPLEVIEVAHPARRVEDGLRLPLSYINFYLANGAVIAPTFDDPADRPALECLQRLFPARRIVPVPGLAIVRGGGCVHCITQQVPAP